MNTTVVKHNYRQDINQPNWLINRPMTQPFIAVNGNNIEVNGRESTQLPHNRRRESVTCSTTTSYNKRNDSRAILIYRIDSLLCVSSVYALLVVLLIIVCSSVLNNEQTQWRREWDGWKIFIIPRENFRNGRKCCVLLSFHLLTRYR